MKPTVVLIPLLVLMAGCSSKAPDPVKLDGGSKASKREANFEIRFPYRVVEDYDVDRLQM